MAKREREKAAKIAENRDKRPVAYAKHIRISPSKVRLVADLVRGKSYDEAVAVLENTPNGSAIAILKLIKSAAANAENNLSMNRDDLFVAEIFTGPGPTLKRINIRARGRVDRIGKRTSHITVRLDSKDDPIGAPKAEKPSAKEASKPIGKSVAEKKPVAKATPKTAVKTATKAAAKPAAKATAAKPVKKVEKPAEKAAPKTSTSKPVAKPATKTASAEKSAAKTAVKTEKPAAKTAAKTASGKAPAKKK